MVLVALCPSFFHFRGFTFITLKIPLGGDPEPYPTLYDKNEEMWKIFYFAFYFIFHGLFFWKIVEWNYLAVGTF